MDISRHDRRRRFTLVLLIITSLALVSLDERGSAIIDSARTAAQDVVSPLQDAADSVINPVSDWLDGLGRANELQDQNEKLRRQLDAAHAEIAAAKASLAQLAQLQNVLDIPNIADGDAITAEVIDSGGGNYSRAFRISKGTASGIGKDMPVVVGAVGKAALVGKVVRVSANSAIVQRIDDATFGIGAQLVQADQNGPKGTAEGQRASSLLRFSVIDQSAASVTLKKGDLAVTLGLITEKFPAGLVVGSVVKTVDAGGAVAREAELRPIVDLDSLTIVKVLRYPPVPVP
jgi:rod shape-determining protein MreC